MSTEQSESTPSAVTEIKAAPSAVTETEAAPAADTTWQVTTPAATTQRVKNLKRVAAGKMVAERTRLAREEQKKAAEAYYAEKQAEAATAAPKPATSTEGESPKSSGLFGLSANQWIGIGGIGVSMAGLYYKREELMAMAKTVFDKFKTLMPAPEPAPELLCYKREELMAIAKPVFEKFKTPKPASVDPKPARDTRPRGFKKMI